MEVLASAVPQIQEQVNPQAALETIAEELKPDSIILGGALYTTQGQLVGTFGEPPALNFSDLGTADLQGRKEVHRRSQQGDRYDVAWPAAMTGGDYVLVVRHNSASVRGELHAFIWRIAGLVFVISLFVTGMTMWVLGVTVIRPILRLRDDLVAAGEAISRHEAKPCFSTSLARKRQDELGEVITAFHQMFQRVQHEITIRTQAEVDLRTEQQKADKLLLNILPAPIAEQLKQNQRAIAQRFEDVTILFADLVDFTPLASRMTATDLVAQLNTIFSAFDRLVEKHGLEKIKTIGDAYMVVGGLPNPDANHAGAIAEMALEMQQVISRFRADTGEPFRLRIGINTGPVVSGVIGLKKFSYDLWGNSVNVASRMESQGIPGKIQVTESTYLHLCDRYVLVPRGTIQVKGWGEMNTYFLAGRKDEHSPLSLDETLADFA
jgi:class 3 adenylate cyclase